MINVDHDVSKLTSGLQSTRPKDRYRAWTQIDIDAVHPAIRQEGVVYKIAVSAAKFLAGK